MNVSDEMEKSWDRSWTTEEMRNKRQEWSLAADAGLLKHLQQFSENLVSKANKTQQAIDSLTTQLGETAIIIDNLTNTSLALANTQFIESRVQEDDIEIKKEVEQELPKTDFLTNIIESVKQGLNVMDEKYKRMEVIDSDSEDEGDTRVMSVILGPKDPYQDRPLPYVIGSHKWNTSNKIGLESSSSESEQVDEEEDDSESYQDEVRIQESFDSKNGPNIDTGLTSSLSVSEKSNDASYMNHGKLDSISQNTMSFASDCTTPVKDPLKVQVTNESPNFAEELAKRLGNVRQTLKPPITNESREPSINKFKDDNLFTPENDGIEDFFNDKPNNLFEDNKEILEDNVSAKLWQHRPVFQSNIIPPSMDVPPPISTISTKPKSAIDDLFDKGDSEDSDDIFSSKQPVKRITKDATSESKQAVNTENVQNKFLDVVIGKTTKTNWATSTPESNVEANNLFSEEEEEDDNDLFGTSKKNTSKSMGETQKNRVNTEDNDKKKPAGDSLIIGGVLTSSIENALSSKIPRRQSSDSSSSDTESNYEVAFNNEPLFEDNSLQVVRDQSSNITARAGNSGNWNVNLENSENSSGISIKRHSISSTMALTMPIDEVSSSTRLNSAEFYRERIINDSLFVANTLHPPDVNSTSFRTSNNQSNTEQTIGNISTDDVFENKDFLGPPPLPKADSKTNKSKIPSLFDDSDSGDELFSTTSSGSRSQKSTDFLATTPQFPDKNKLLSNNKGLFDDDIDIFSNKDSPDVDITGNFLKPYKDNIIASKRFQDIASNNFSIDKTHSTNVSKESNIIKLPANSTTSTKKNSLFDDEEDDNVDDLFGVKKTEIKSKIEDKMFTSDPENDLFSVKPSTKTTKVMDKKTLSREEETTVEDIKRQSLLSKDTSLEGTVNNFVVTTKQDKGQDNQKKDALFEEDDYEDLFVNDKKEKKKVEVESKIEDSKESNEIISKKESVQVEVKFSDNFDDNNSTDVDNKKHPPTTLNIRTTTSSSAEDNSQMPRRTTVSGKIKDLMGKMGDLKILSPTDTPPLWRKSEEKTDEEDDVIDRDSDDGGCIAKPIQTPPTENTELSKQQIRPDSNGNTESAISFDVPAQVETLSTASKSRVRIQAKRRPQSRHARKSALRQSGLDFDTVDTIEKIPQGESSVLSKESSNNSTGHGVVPPNDDRLTLSSSSFVDNTLRHVELNPSTGDDKSELGSISKESSISANKNTLLSPSTDEEDLFDVPPDLPEDSQREDALFGRAPILSPIQNVLPDREPTYGRPLRDTIIGGNDENEETIRKDSIKSELSSHNNSISDTSFDVDDNEKKIEVRSNEIERLTKFQETRTEQIDDSTESTNDVFEQEYLKGPIDPLHDNTYDPLKDPSQLFAFVTKTPSPDKGKDLLFSDDDSLFSSRSIKTNREESIRKQVSNLFEDDASGDLFSVPLPKSVKKTLKDTKISFFDEDSNDQNDEDDSLFGPIAKKMSVKNEEEKSIVTAKVSQKKINLFQDDDEDDDNDATSLFAEQQQSVQTPKVELSKVPQESGKLESILSVDDKPVNKPSKLADIFGDQSSTEDDIFTSIKPVSKKIIQNKSLFAADSDDDDSQFFGKSSSLVESTPNESRPIVKKSVTRDLKKTAEKIVEDPLSIFKDD
ncbi:PREDICTED: WASH complex subunit FAM21 [Polistes dominula]|uniref:WASH complex subunit FAM21 n=1 Tax=Polistes dominula TaxID=743375 RepID=A0ABM1HYZ3_POLDO|nr:PREDICTED: WASH complex subunit FAM21 [Polistes dominula]